MRQTKFAQTMNIWLRSKLDNIHTIIPGKIVSYEGHTTRKAEVQPLVSPKTVHNKVLTVDPIKDVPVVFPSNGKFNLLFPLTSGDGVLLLFAESPIGNFLSGSGVRAVEADDLNKFDMTDCIAVPGLWSFNNVPSSAQISIEIGDDDSITLQTTLGKIKIEKSGNITFDDGTEPMILGTTFNTWLTAQLIVWATTHTHSGVSSGGSNTGTSNQPLVAPNNHLSNFIKGK